MEITLTPELDAWVQERVRIGDFDNAHEAVVTAVALLQWQRESEERGGIPDWNIAEAEEALDELTEEERNPPENFFPSDEEIAKALEMAGVDHHAIMAWLKRVPTP